MTVYVLIREDQSQHGYIDVSIAGIFRQKQTAQEIEETERRASSVGGPLEHCRLGCLTPDRSCGDQRG